MLEFLYIKEFRQKMGSFKKLILNKLEQMFPNYLKLGNDCLLKKKYKEAIENYKKALPIQGANPLLHYNWAASLFAIGEYKESLSKFKQATRIKNDFTDAYVHWGLALINLNQPHQAFSKFKYAEKYNPTDPKIHFHFGLLLEQLEKTEDAMQKYEKVIELSTAKDGDENNQYHIMALNQLALIQLRQENYPETAKRYTHLLKLSPDFAPAYYNLAIANLQMQKNEESVQNLKRAIELDYQVTQRVRKDPAFGVLLNHPDIQNYFK